MKTGKLLLFLTLFTLVGFAAMALTAQQVLQNVEDRYVGDTSRANVVMTLYDADGSTRERRMSISRREMDSDNKDNHILFAAPPDIRNTTYLVNERDREERKWIYLSAFRNVRRIGAEDYGLSFVASDFTYEDMDDIRADDYTATDLKEEMLGDKEVYSIVVRKNDGNTSYDRTVMKVWKDEWVILKSEMYCKRNPDRLIKVMTAENLEQIQDIWTPMLVTMKDVSRGTKTTLQTARIAYDLEIPEDVFSRRNLER